MIGERVSRAGDRVAAMAVLACIACLTPQALAQSRAPAIAPMVKTLHVAFPVAETGFDPQATSDL